MADARTSAARQLMTAFAERTRIGSRGQGRRYLWTDAFAVCNFLALGDDARAVRLVDDVHHGLGRFRDDDERTGWISGARDAEGEAHPTRGGLRIGKPLRERGPGEPLDPDAEWDRDGQYFHYLTKWAHALDRVARATREPKYHAWARELMDAAHRAFVHGPRGRRRMVWKLSTDLSRPLVASMGQHDPLDGFVTCAALDATASELGTAKTPNLAGAAADFAEMIRPEGLATADPLGLGGLLFDVWRLVRIDPVNDELVAWLLEAAMDGLREYLARSELLAPADRRLAFRELGLATGLAGLSALAASPRIARLGDRAIRLARYAPLRAEIESFWLVPAHRQSALWVEHEDIDDVMLATSLVPEGFLGSDLGSLASVPREPSDDVLV